MQKIAKALLFLAGAVIFIIYALPLFAAILNIGNAFGMGVGIVLILCSVFIDAIIKLVKSAWENKVLNALVIVICVFAISFVSAFAVTMNSIVSYAKYTASDETTVVVLGCKVRGDTPSAMLYWRSSEAAKYLENNPNSVAILSGGKGDGENISEAECMFNIITDYGISEDRLFVEDKSTSTEENMRFSKEIIDDNNLSTDIAIATSDYHEKRASMIAKKNGLNSSSIPAYGDMYSRPTFYTREVFGVWLQYLR